MFTIAGLSFVFGFGNGWTLGLQLGVTPWIAPLVAPAVDLSVIGLLTCLHYLRTQAVDSHLITARLLLLCCGVLTFALNTARPILAHQAGRACFDGIAPFLLLGWSEVGPKLLTLLHATAPEVERIAVPARQNEPRTAPDEKVPSAELLATARQLDAAHRAATRRPITRDKLRAELKTSSATASELIRIVRSEPST
ncbi:MAG TPA: hypothetical protein VGX23_23670 [Actinocrinis sp.]|nr:hypothetical protein [Actinocrinis sp.]